MKDAIKTLAEFASTHQIAGDFLDKEEFHRLGKSACRQIARDVGLAPGTFDIRSTKGGIAVVGEITLHTDRLYLQIGREPLPILVRSCSSRKDYSGGANYYLSYSQLIKDYSNCILAFKLIQGVLQIGDEITVNGKTTGKIDTLGIVGTKCPFLRINGDTVFVVSRLLGSHELKLDIS